ncbi:MAG: D-alanyl-D-alanine carboxypeptidase family protein [Clostridia bacterium]|nr:D-alanyl-D-alanine carboxypeptidase family protein [Clostridia bacterium]
MNKKWTKLIALATVILVSVMMLASCQTGKTYVDEPGNADVVSVKQKNQIQEVEYTGDPKPNIEYTDDPAYADTSTNGGSTGGDTTGGDTTGGGNTTGGNADTTDKPEEVTYTFINKDRDALQLGLLQLINEQYLYGFKEEGIRVTLGEHRPTYKSYQLSKWGHELKLDAANALNQMMDDFYLVTGYTYLNINKAYYDFDSQKALFDKGQTDTPAGASDWHSGATFRFTGYNQETGKTVNITNAEEPQWLKTHAHEYGFIFRAPSNKNSIVGYTEPWQLRYVGMPHAEYMYKNNLCLEEYLTKLSTDFAGMSNAYTLKCADGNTYMVYYIEAPDEGTLRLPVPGNRSYTVSGDNMNGFIVTVTLETGTRPPLETPAPETNAPDITE